jgi:hypothetical protein
MNKTLFYNVAKAPLHRSAGPSEARRGGEGQWARADDAVNNNSAR